MMVKKYRFILNPIAGQGAAGLALPEIERLADQKSMNFDIIKTERPGHAIELAQAAAMDVIDVVVAVGGDGTANEVLNGLMLAWKQGYKNTSLGVIGIGRGNDFAYAFGIPKGLQAGFDLIQQGESRLMDIGFITGGDYPQGRYFGNGVGIGFDAVVGFEALKLTHLHGFLNYVVAALRTIFLFFNAPHVRIQLDDNQISQPSLMVSVMNGRRMGGGFMMAPTAHPDDGKFDLCIAGQLSRLGILAMIPRFMKGTQSPDPKITTAQSGNVTVTALDGVLPAHADGETICTAGKELKMEILPQALNVIHGTFEP